MVSGCFPPVVTELNSCDKDNMVQKPEILFNLKRKFPGPSCNVTSLLKNSSMIYSTYSSS